MYLGDNEIFLDELPRGIVFETKINPNEKWVKHIHCDGARFHVLRWLLYGGIFGDRGITITRCSEPDCIVNKIADEEIEKYDNNISKRVRHWNQ